ncbi:MAG: hypothetical protein MUC92_08440 [Fimbriimonadaceae bacterium]|jgi:hypothetical protein|nr:hypothetical protein [Fimbriimonadaceae bacterium]
MSKVKEGDRVKIVARTLSAQDKKVNSFFGHMQGLTAKVANYYSDEEIAIEVDLETLPDIQLSVHESATRRMRARFENEATEEAKKILTKEELAFTPHYMLLVTAADIEKI